MNKKILINSDKKFPANKNNIKKMFVELSGLLKFQFSSIEVVFVNDEKIKKINTNYLKHDRTTDIITFDYSESSIVDCELIISYETAFDNAIKYNVDLNSEIIRLLIHGILHVTGYDDKNTSKKIRMKKKENELVKLLTSKFQVLRK